MANGVLSVKNWTKFQHYKHRCPPWIKLAADTFQNPEFACLQDASKLLAVCIWTLASRSQNGTIPDNFDYIKQWGFLGKEIKIQHLTELVDAGFLVRDASCKQDASTLHTNADSETEKSRDRVETETDGQIEFENSCSLYPNPERGHYTQEAYFSAIGGIRKRAKKDGAPITDAEAIMWLNHRIEEYGKYKGNYAVGFRKFLDERIFDQNPATWSGKNGKSKGSFGVLESLREDARKLDDSGESDEGNLG